MTPERIRGIAIEHFGLTDLARVEAAITQAVKESRSEIFDMMEAAPGLPLEMCSMADLEKWTGVIMNVIYAVTPERGPGKERG